MEGEGVGYIVGRGRAACAVAGAVLRAAVSGVSRVGVAVLVVGGCCLLVLAVEMSVG